MSLTSRLPGQWPPWARRQRQPQSLVARREDAADGFGVVFAAEYIVDEGNVEVEFPEIMSSCAYSAARV